MADDAAGLPVDPRGAHVVVGSWWRRKWRSGIRSSPGHSSRSWDGPATGAPGKVSWQRIPDFLRPPAAEPVEGTVAAFRRIGVRRPHRAQDGEDVRVTTRRSIGRETGDGSSRQLAACVASATAPPTCTASRCYCTARWDCRR